MDTIRSGQVDVSIVVDGRYLPIYPHDGRYFIAGEMGKHYAILVRNNTNSRLEILESVDGRDVLKDQAASLSNAGMIVSARRVWDNHGWRINDNETRDFVFSDPSAAIAAQATGSMQGVGVIGVAVFTERWRDDYDTWRKWTSKAGGQSLGGPSTSAMYRSDAHAVSSLSADLGTGMGQARADSVGHTTFERAFSSPIYTVEIQYRTREWLVEQGIIDTQYPSAFPKAFPDDTGYGKYAK